MHHIHIVILVRCHQGGSSAGICQLACDLGKYLGHCQSILYSPVTVNEDTQFLLGFFQPGTDLGSTLYTLHNGSHFPCNLLQGIQVTAPDLDGDAASSHGTHVHTGSIYGNLCLQALGLLLDDPGNVFIAHGFVFPGQHIYRGGVAASAAASATQKGHGGSTGHGTYILHIFNGENRLHHLVCHLPCLLQGGILLQFHIDSELGRVHVCHECRSI